MPRPGTDIEITEPHISRGAILDTGQAFFLGVSERGTVDRAIECHSLRDYERQCGSRSGGEQAWLAAYGFFAQRGATLYFARLAGAKAKTSSATVGLFDAEATSPGAWGNSLAVAVETETGLLAGAAHLLTERRSGHKSPAKPRAKTSGDATTQEMPVVRVDDDGNDDPEDGDEPTPYIGLRVVVRLAGKVVERSVLVTTAGDAVTWSRRSDYVQITSDEPDKALVAVASKPLTGGASDIEIDADIVAGALEHYGSDLGPGQVAYPGETGPEIAELIFAHCDQYKRCALRDLPDTDEPTLLAAETLALYGKLGVRKAAGLAPPIIYPGPAGAVEPVTIAYSALQAGVIAREDRASGNPNQAAAGVNGIIQGALGIAHDYTDDTREQLNEAGVTLAKVVLGDVRTYGSRTAAGPDDQNWLWFGGSRVIMAIAHEADAKAEFYVHQQIDGRGTRFAELEKDLVGVCMHYYDLEALYGDTPAEAFYVDTRGPNTVDTIKKGEIHAAIGLKTSPSAEWILIQLSKYPIDATLAAAA